ncbi:36295_t:CDS:2, partial [Racocetra persica]
PYHQPDVADGIAFSTQKPSYMPPTLENIFLELSKDLSCAPPSSTEGVIPNVIEVSFGVERLMLAILEDACCEETVDSGLTRTVLKLHPLLAPYFVAVIPLSKQLQEKAYQIYQELLTETNFTTTYEEASSIGKAYRRQDAIGTYYCLTIDFQTLQDDT